MHREEDCSMHGSGARSESRVTLGDWAGTLEHSVLSKDHKEDRKDFACKRSASFVCIYITAGNILLRNRNQNDLDCPQRRTNPNYRRLENPRGRFPGSEMAAVTIAHRGLWSVTYL